MSVPPSSSSGASGPDDRSDVAGSAGKVTRARLDAHWRAVRRALSSMPFNDRPQQQGTLLAADAPRTLPHVVRAGVGGQEGVPEASVSPWHAVRAMNLFKRLLEAGYEAHDIVLVTTSARPCPLSVRSLAGLAQREARNFAVRHQGARRAPLGKTIGVDDACGHKLLIGDPVSATHAFVTGAGLQVDTIDRLVVSGMRWNESRQYDEILLLRTNAAGDFEVLAVEAPMSRFLRVAYADHPARIMHARPEVFLLSEDTPGVAYALLGPPGDPA